MIKLMVVALCVVAAAGCAPHVEYARPDATSTWVFSKPGASAAGYASDKEACQTQAVAHWKDKIAPYGKRNEERQMMNSCMVFRGWKMERNRAG